jgi:hypothetical protein
MAKIEAGVENADDDCCIALGAVPSCKCLNISMIPLFGDLGIVGRIDGTVAVNGGFSVFFDPIKLACGEQVGDCGFQIVGWKSNGVKLISVGKARINGGGMQALDMGIISEMVHSRHLEAFGAGNGAGIPLQKYFGIGSGFDFEIDFDLRVGVRCEDLPRRHEDTKAKYPPRHQGTKPSPCRVFVPSWPK